jgi:hypothetical protein
LVNDQVHGQITPQAACAIVDAIAAKETAQ